MVGSKREELATHLRMGRTTNYDLDPRIAIYQIEGEHDGGAGGGIVAGPTIEDGVLKEDVAGV